jgi:hypothetical protein
MWSIHHKKKKKNGIKKYWCKSWLKIDNVSVKQQ